MQLDFIADCRLEIADCKNGGGKPLTAKSWPSGGLVITELAGGAASSRGNALRLGRNATLKPQAAVRATTQLTTGNGFGPWA